MRFFLAAILLVAVAGCTAPAAPKVEAPAAPVDAGIPAATVTLWRGHIIDSLLDTPSHIQPSEGILFPMQQEGFLFDIKEIPTVLQVALEWKGAGKLMIMLHSHKDHGSNVYDEHITPLDGENPKCLEVPTEDLSLGEWQIMVHSEGARQLDYTLAVRMAGGEGAVVADKMHGHNLQDGAFEVSEKKILPCQTLTVA